MAIRRGDSSSTMEGRAIDAFASTLAGELELIEAAAYAAETARINPDRPA
ncbi:hypothetical protein JHN63_42300 [Streptomyces sp. MBT65]|nr:hypothetical protein [Streptomyces sp. MBT65]MBK3580312.1 hypothetical protein [Streptomyces sp. MBT65]